MEEITIEILKTNCQLIEISNYIELVTTALVSLNFLKCKAHGEQIRKFVLKKSIFFFIIDWCKEVSNIICGKTTVFDETDPIKLSANEYFVKHRTKKSINK